MTHTVQIRDTRVYNLRWNELVSPYELLLLL